jgi:tetratricopeptide (TPR) repeat protein
MLLTGIECMAQEKEIRSGNAEFEKGRFRNAETEYLNSLSKDPKQYIGNYNLGSSLYRQNKYDDAAKQYLNAGSFSGKRDEKARSFYNMGNALLKAEKYEESVNAYKQSLKLNPADEDARYNLAYALQRLKKQQEQNQQNQQNNKDQKDQKDKLQQQQQQNNDKNKQQDKQNQDKNQEQQANKDQQKKPQPKLSKEEAERMLQALKNDEKNLQKEKAKKFQTSVGGPRKNW